MSSNKLFPYGGNNKFKQSVDKLKAKAVSPLVSDDIDCNAATGAIVAVEIPAGAYVYRVGVRAITALAGGSGDIDIGDGDDADGYFDALTALAVKKLVIAPVPASTTTATAECGGKYYAAQDTIDVTINATAAAGTIRVYVWYDIVD